MSVSHSRFGPSVVKSRRTRSSCTGGPAFLVRPRLRLSRQIRHAVPRGFWANPYSTSTRTEWGFTSAAGEPGTTAVLPLIQLDYKVDTDTSGKARRNAELVVAPSHLPGGPSSKAICALTLDISYDDGATWQKASLTHRGDGWETTLHAPAKTAYATLRTSAHDRQGNSVTQSITRAFGLK